MTDVTTSTRRTLADVAAAAGVSVATASKVLNQRPEVAVATRRRVEAAIEDLGYTPTNGPRSGGRRTVCLVFDTLINAYSTQVLNGLLHAATELGVEIVVDVLDAHAGGRDTPLAPTWIRAQAGPSRLGVIAVTVPLSRVQVRSFQEAGVNLVLIDPLQPPDDPDITSVGSTNYQGGVQATEHLLRLGHRRIAFAGGLAHSTTSRERQHGYRSALEVAGIPVDEELILDGAFTYSEGVRMGTRLLALEKPPTAVFAGCDASAFGILEAARRAHRRVPEDLSVVGFDDTPAALWSAPPLTTVHQPLQELCAVALRTLLERAEGRPHDSHHIQLATQLVERESTAAIPG